MKSTAPDHSNTLQRTPAAPQRERFWLFAALLVVVLFLLATLFGERGIMREVQYKRQKEKLEQELGKVEAQNTELRQEIEALRNNRKYIEGIARRELGMVKPDEIVYQFPPSGEPASTVKRPGVPR